MPPRKPDFTDAAARWRTSVAELGIWKRGGQRAVHKPLLTLMLLARAARGEPAAVPFEEIDEPLTALLAEFGPPRKSYHPEYPFWHLQTDGFWIAEGEGALPMRKRGNSPSKGTLRAQHATGRVPEEMWDALVADQNLRCDLASDLLEQYWPPSYHEELRAAIGLESAPRTRRHATRVVRDPRFREHILRAYERRCAVCGYDGRLGRDDLALEAAHIRWHCFGGPDDVSNGLALCTMHHAALDRGALGLDRDGRVLVSADVHGNESVEWLLLRFSGQPLRVPQRGMPTPHAAHVAWHSREVFRSPARSSA